MAEMTLRGDFKATKVLYEYRFLAPAQFPSFRIRRKGYRNAMIKVKIDSDPWNIRLRSCGIYLLYNQQQTPAKDKLISLHVHSLN